jgi:hypothetical protein
MHDRFLARLSVWQATGVFLVLTLVLTWPQAIAMTSIPDHRDAYFNLWRIGWIAHQIVADPSRLFDANIYHPMPNALALSDAILLEGLAGAPLIWMGMPTVVAGNLLVFAGFVASGVGMFVLVRELAGNSWAGMFAGIIFTFAPFRFDHYMHLEMLWAQWMPLALWSFHRVLISGRWRDGLLTGLFIGLQGLSSIYYAVFFATTIVVMAPVLVIGRSIASWRRAVLPLAGGAAIAIVMLLPYARPYQAAAAQVGERGADEALLYAAGPAHYLAATPDNVVYGGLTSRFGRHEKYLFPGLATIALTRLAYAVVLVVAIDLSFGPRGPASGWLRDHVMYFRGLRAPARAGQIVLLAAGVLAGFGLTRVMQRWNATAAVARRAAAVAVGVCLLLVIEFMTWPRVLVPVETRATAVYDWLRTQPAGVLAEVPLPVPPAELGLFSGQFDFLSTFHWRPMINGYSGTYPGHYVRLLAETRDFPSDTSLAALRGAGVTHLIVHERFLGRDRYEAVTAALDARVDLEAFGPFPEGTMRAAAYRWR